MSRPSRGVAALAVVASSLLGDARHAAAQSCVGSLSKIEYPLGFSAGDLASAVNAGIINPQPNSLTLAPGFAIGQVVSQPISTEIPGPSVGDYTVGKISLHAVTSFPAPCPGGSTLGGVSATRIDLYWSVDNGVTWFIATFPAGTTTSGDVLIDPLALGTSGNKLVWKAVFITSTAMCQPRLTALAVGYEGMNKGTYLNTEAIPVGNVMVRASYELAATAWTDRTPRGHVEVKQLYSLDTVPLTDYTDPLHTPPNAGLWTDAGAKVTFPLGTPIGSGPDLRQVFYNGGAGIASAFNAAVASVIGLVLPGGVRGVSYAGQWAYDFDGNNNVDDTDANWLIYWVRGWATGTLRSAPKQWGLGAIMHSTPAVVGPPGDPWWLGLSGTPAAERTQFGTPCASAVPNSFLALRGTRRAVAIVGSMDGLFHAFDLGQFRWCDDPSTALTETRGWFFQKGARDFGDGKEVWAWAPPGMMDGYRKQPARSLPWAVSAGLPRANADASITVADICMPPANPPLFPVGGNPGCTFKTVMVAPETRNHPYITALDVTDSSVSPKPLWSEDWPPASESDSTFEGTEQAPSVGPVLARTPGAPTRRWMMATTSGITSTIGDLYLYLVDFQLGKTWNNFGARDGWGRVKLNVVGPNANCSGQVNGAAGPPAMVDSDADGVVDRIYVADTKGCLYKVETSTMNVCVLGALGESVFSPIAVRVADDVTSRVQIFVGGGDDPDALDLGPAPARFHLFGLEDDDLPGGCTVPKNLFDPTNAGTVGIDLTPGNPGGGIVHKLWSAPVVNGDAVYVGTAVGDLNDPCGSDPLNPGVLEAWQFTSSAVAAPRQILAPVALAGNAVGGVRLFDGHLFANTANGSTTVFGRPSSWTSSMTSVNPNGGDPISSPLWLER